MPAWQYWLVVAAWIGWEVYWGLSSRGMKRIASQEPLSSRLTVLATLILAFVFLLVPEWLSDLLVQTFLPPGGFFFYLGFGILLEGMAFTVWARQSLGRNWSGRVTIKVGHELVTRGPYALVRHPIYLGASLAIVGSVVALGRIGGLVSMPLFLGVFLYKIRLEERILEEHFGEKYAEYRRKTAALIPGLW